MPPIIFHRRTPVIEQNVGAEIKLLGFSARRR
jgi:hypothetical protein